MGVEGLVMPLLTVTVMFALMGMRAEAVKLTSSTLVTLLYVQNGDETVRVSMATVHVGELAMVKSGVKVKVRAGVLASGCPIKKLKV